jgi:hypothetical protein
MNRHSQRIRIEYEPFSTKNFATRKSIQYGGTN